MCPVGVAIHDCSRVVSYQAVASRRQRRNCYSVHRKIRVIQSPPPVSGELELSGRRPGSFFIAIADDGFGPHRLASICFI